MANAVRLKFCATNASLTVAGGVTIASNTAAVLRAVLGTPTRFQRTPKFALRQRAETWVKSTYALNGDPLLLGELAMGILALTLLILPGTRWGFVPWLLMYLGSFAYVATLGLFQLYKRARWLATQTRAGAGAR